VILVIPFLFIILFLPQPSVTVPSIVRPSNHCVVREMVQTQLFTLDAQRLSVSNDC
jgi:hypothetical protein